MNIKLLAVAGIIALTAYFAWSLFTGPSNANEDTAVVIPEFSEIAQSGQIAFEKSCAACHGVNALGTDKGPTLLHAFYKAGHHGDASFENAAKRGVRQHHWRFGDMPPVAGITDAEILSITKYVRELQAANGY